MWGRPPRPQFNCPYLSVDANSTEFNPESKHPVVCYLPQPRSFVIQSSLPTSRVISTGDWNAGAQPGADGRHHALGEEENYFQVQEQRNEYVSSRQQHSLPLSLSDVLWFLIAEKLYGNVDFVDERHRHRFEVEATDRRTDLPSIRLRGFQNWGNLETIFARLFSCRRWTQRWRPTLRKTVCSLSARMWKAREWRLLNWMVSCKAVWAFHCNLINGARWLQSFMAEPWGEQASFPPPTHLPTVLSDHCYFVGVQYHPEFTSRPIKPSPPYFGLLLAAAGKLQSYLAKGCQLSPRYERARHSFAWTRWE